MSDLSAKLEPVSAFVVAIGTLLGLIWTVTKIILRQEHAQRIEFVAAAKVIDIHNKHALVGIELTVHNKGKVRLRIFDFYLKVFGFHKKDAILENLAQASVVHSPSKNNQTIQAKKNSTIQFRHLIHSSSAIPSNWNYTFIQPNIVQKYNYSIWVPPEMLYIRVRGKFYYYDKSNPHVAESVIKIPQKRRASLDA